MVAARQLRGPPKPSGEDCILTGGLIGQRLEQPGEAGGLAGGDRLAQQRRAARLGQREGWPVLDADG